MLKVDKCPLISNNDFATRRLRSYRLCTRCKPVNYKPRRYIGRSTNNKYDVVAAGDIADKFIMIKHKAYHYRKNC